MNRFLQSLAPLAAGIALGFLLSKLIETESKRAEVPGATVASPAARRASPGALPTTTGAPSEDKQLAVASQTGSVGVFQ